MKLSSFDYYLPKELIAQYPETQRDNCRMLVVNRSSGLIEHKIFKDILDYLHKDDLLVLNDTKVMPARLFAKRKTGGKVEFLLLRRIKDSTFQTLISPGRVKIGEEVIFDNNGLRATLTAKDKIAFNIENIGMIYAHGVMPLPPYIKRGAEELDKKYYQTVYAQNEGSAAAPTAGLHFTEELLRKIKSQGINIANLTLHVGLGTFKPVDIEDVLGHKIHPEEFSVPQSTIKAVEVCRKNKGRIIAIGTTSTRTLETLAQGKTQGQTDLFIYPGYKFQMVDMLLTNFHLPKTTLFMLVAAFCGLDLAQKAYAVAVENKYRFYSYGDAMLII